MILTCSERHQLAVDIHIATSLAVYMYCMRCWGKLHLNLNWSCDLARAAYWTNVPQPSLVNQFQTLLIPHETQLQGDVYKCMTIS